MKNYHSITDSGIEILKKHFEFDQIFNLIEYGADMSRLYHDLLLLKKESYHPNYRFIFQHWDTDYYITVDQPGLTLRNLQRVLVSLDISNYFCLILTHQDIEDELEVLRAEETVDDCAIASIQTILQNLLWIPAKDIDLSPESIPSKYQCFSRVRRSHRTLLFALLQDRNLLKDGMVSFSSSVSANPT